eukprot:CAMPEP_0201505500 /NCGR_PEP_ID=MMETSP0151_2-20130828/85809_1 /ASSEMBLY_ACC=CAM_ASM_000257 /TAXON_ID=200890 /ORGANISM="Paramoeba atlantica, Strain 621/1 / CCAP 1560/9" /LENGTH=275 /DNA_ID=CAMNT_0047899383 /DNA_START=236 /DNA_END=1061 /DNA_ORIENTATION=+
MKIQKRINKNEGGDESIVAVAKYGEVEELLSFLWQNMNGISHSFFPAIPILVFWMIIFSTLVVTQTMSFSYTPFIFLFILLFFISRESHLVIAFLQFNEKGSRPEEKVVHAANYDFLIHRFSPINEKGSRPEEKVVHAANYDFLMVLIIGIGPVVLLVSVVFFLWRGGNDALTFTYILVGSLFLVALFFWVYLPQTFELEEKNFAICSGWPMRYKFEFDSVLDVRPVDKYECECYLKLATAFNDIILIKTKYCNILISPQNSHQFIEDMKKKMQV